MMLIFKKHKKIFVPLILILLLAGFLRFYKLGSQSLIADEYIGANISYGFHEAGQWKYWDFNKEEITDREYTRGRIYYWQVAKVLDFLEPTEANLRLVSVLWGLFGVVSIFLVTWLFTKKWTIAFFSAFLVAVSISSIMYDRKLRMYSMLVPAYLWLSYFLYMFIESKAQKGWAKVKWFSEKTGLNWNFFLPSLLAGVVSLATHRLTMNIAVVIVVYFFVMGIVSLRKSGQIKNRYFVYLLGSLALFALSLNLLYARNSLRWFTFFENNWSYLEKATFDYSYILLAGAFFVMGVIYLLRRHSKRGVWIVVSYLTILFLAIMSWDRNAGHQYLLFSQSFKIMIVASGIFFFSKTLSEKVFKNSKWWFWGIAAASMILLINFSFLFSSKEGFYGNIHEWSYPNYRESFEYFLRHKGENSALVSRAITNYYHRGADIDQVLYTSDEKLELEQIMKAQEKYDELWVIFTSDIFIKKAAEEYIRDNFEKIETKFTNENVQIWVWKNGNNNLKIGFATDAHCYAKQDKDTGQWDINWRCQRAMSEFSKEMNNNFHPDIVIDGGDLSDGKDKRGMVGLKEYIALYDEVSAPAHFVLGNHELREVEKSEWVKAVKTDREYYFVDVKNFRVFILDGNHLTSGVDISPEKRFYPGVIDEEQMTWLKEALVDAGDRQKIVFVHQPPLDGVISNHQRIFVNGNELRSVFSKHGVKAVFSGHIEKFCAEEVGGVKYYIMNGFWKANKTLEEAKRFKDAGVFSEIEIDKTDLLVKVFHNDGKYTDYKSFDLAGEEHSCK